MWTRNLPLPAAPCGNRAILVAGRPLRKPVKPSTTGSTLARAFARAPGVLGSGGRFEGIGFSPSRFAARAQRLCGSRRGPERSGTTPRRFRRRRYADRGLAPADMCHLSLRFHPGGAWYRAADTPRSRPGCGGCLPAVAAQVSPDRIDVFGALKNLGEVTGLIQSSARRFLRSHWSAVPP